MLSKDAIDFADLLRYPGTPTKLGFQRIGNKFLSNLTIHYNFYQKMKKYDLISALHPVKNGISCTIREIHCLLQFSIYV